jgi:hypothetical protein
MKDNLYYENLQKSINDRIVKANSYVIKSNTLKKYHESIKDKKVIYKMIDKLVCWEIRNYRKMAIDIHVKDFKQCIDEIDELQKILDRKA